jgi:hypothetical protein
MAKWDMTKTEKITPLFDDNSRLKEKVSNVEKKLDELLTLLKKEANNDKTRSKPISGDDGGV